MIVTCEYFYDKIKLNETRNIVQNTIEEYEEENGYKVYRGEKVKCVAQFYDKINNDIKIIMINRFNIIGELNKIMQRSKGKLNLLK